MRLKDYYMTHGTSLVYKELGLLKTSKPTPMKLKFVPRKPKDYHIDENGVTHLDTWIAPIAGQMQMLTITGN